MSKTRGRFAACTLACLASGDKPSDDHDYSGVAGAASASGLGLDAPRDRADRAMVLCGDFLCGRQSAKRFAHLMWREGQTLEPFNAVIGDGVHLWYVANSGRACEGPVELQSGTYTLYRGAVDSFAAMCIHSSKLFHRYAAMWLEGQLSTDKVCRSAFAIMASTTNFEGDDDGEGAGEPGRITPPELVTATASAVERSKEQAKRVFLQPRWYSRQDPGPFGTQASYVVTLTPNTGGHFFEQLWNPVTEEWDTAADSLDFVYVPRNRTVRSYALPPLHQYCVFAFCCVCAVASLTSPVPWLRAEACARSRRCCGRSRCSDKFGCDPGAAANS